MGIEGVKGRVYVNTGYDGANVALISDSYNTRVTTIKIPEMKKFQKLVNLSKSQSKRSDLDGYRPASKEVVQIGTHDKTFRDSSSQIGNG